MAFSKSFKDWLVIEMHTTSDEKNRLREIISNLVQGNRKWLGDNFILSGDKGKYWILNYLQGPRNEYNKLVRGLIVEKPSPGWHGDPLQLIKSFPFTRFFNQGESDADPVDINNSEMLEKMDGTLVGVYFPSQNPRDPHWHTRKMMSSHPDDMSRTITGFHGKSYKFLPTIGDYVKKLNFSQDDIENTYIFEFIHDASTVLTKYTPEQYGLYLIGGRNIPTHKEFSEDELDAIAKKVGSHRPRRWNAVASHDEIIKMMKEISKETKDFEGFVFRDKTTGKRIKLKDPEYVRIHHLLGKGSFKELLLRVLEGEEDEVLAYFPGLKPKIDILKQKYAKFVDLVTERVMYWKSFNLDRKSLALKIFGEKGEDNRFISSMVMKNLDTNSPEDVKKNVDDTLRRIALGDSKDPDTQNKNAGSPKKLIELIGLHDDDDEDDNPDVGEL